MKNLIHLSIVIVFALSSSLVYYSKANSNELDPLNLNRFKRGLIRFQIDPWTIPIQYYEPNSKKGNVEIEIQNDTDKWEKVTIANGNVFTTHCFASKSKVARISTLNENKEKKTKVYTLTCGERYGVIWNSQKLIWEIYHLKPRENE
jgi:hypothetical protein